MEDVGGAGLYEASTGRTFLVGAIANVGIIRRPRATTVSIKKTLRNLMILRSPDQRYTFIVVMRSELTRPTTPVVSLLEPPFFPRLPVAGDSPDCGTLIVPTRTSTSPAGTRTRYARPFGSRDLEGPSAACTWHVKVHVRVHRSTADEG